MEPWATPPLPHDSDANDQPPRLGVLAGSFAYIGEAKLPAAFAAYVDSFDFGPTPPDFLVLHHTAIPAASWAPFGDPARWWDAGEKGLSIDQVRAKRLRQLDAIRNHYRDHLGWGAGPHLFVDDRWVYLFTPLDTVGIHARGGNAYHADGQLHYSIGLEVVGHYERVAWPPAVRANVASAVQALQQRLGTFALAHQLGAGGVSSHRDWGKPACPGSAITESYYLSVLRSGAPSDDAVWAQWGAAYPLPEEQRGYGIPQLWLHNSNWRWLGSATSDELASGAAQAVRFFQGGAIVWRDGKGFLVNLPKANP